jgi:O-antigen/teichoic acid export membrane protein
VDLLKLGMLFFVLQMACSVVFTTDNLILASHLGPASVASYAPAVRIFSLAPLLMGFFLTPLWPAYGEAHARGDYPWIIKTFKRSIWIILAVVPPFTLFMFFQGERLLGIWLRMPVHLPHGLLLGMGIWTILMTLGDATAMLLNGLHIVKFQVLAASCMAILSIILRIIGVRMFGVPGVVWGLTIAYFICSSVPAFFYSFRLLGGMQASDPEPKV